MSEENFEAPGKPEIGLNYIRPDEVAECWDDVDEDLYRELWACTQHYEKINFEDNGPHDVIGINSVSTFWKHFSRESQEKLNKLARAQNEETYDSPDFEP